MATIKRSFLILLFSALSWPLQAADLDFERLDLPNAVDRIEDGKPLLLYVGLSTCGFCRRLEAEVMPVVLKDEAYTDKVFVQKVLWDSGRKVNWKGGQQATPDEIAREFRIRATPTLLFLDADGNEIAERIEGYRDASFYWSYLDDSIDEAVQALAQ